MKKSGVLLLGFVLALPLQAQDTWTPKEDAPPSDASAPPPSDANATPPADTTATPPPDASATPPADAGATPPADATATPPADASATPPADATATDASATPADGAPVAEAPPAEATAAVESAPAEEAAPSEPVDPWIFYVGASYGSTKLSISNLSGLEQTDTTTWMYQGRVGMRITNGIGLEAHYGKGKDDENPYQAKVEDYYGIYIVPTGTLLDMVEFAFPLGFAWTKVSGYSVGQGSGAPPPGTKVSTSLDGVSYGMNVEFPFRLLSEAIPDIRLVGGGMVYQQNNSARTYGWHAGLRFDFAVGGSAPEPQPVAEVVAAPPPEPAPEAPPPPPPPCQAPAPGQPANLEGCKGGETLVLQGVNFEFDKAELTINAKTLLDQVADELNKHPELKFEINGHTDAKGSDTYNQKLSDQRAASVKDYLASKNVDASRMTAHGFGETMPVADNNTDEGRETNRRVELKVTESGSAAAEAAAPVADGSAPASSDATVPAPEATAPAPEATAPAPEATAPAPEAAAPAPEAPTETSPP